MTTTFRQQWEKLKDRLYRRHFVEAAAKRAIPFQMRSLLKKQNISQSELAERAGLTQGVISRALNPNYGNLTINTIVRIAAGFDVAFVGKFVPFSEFLRTQDRLSEEAAGTIPTFEQEDALSDSTAVKVDASMASSSSALFNMIRKPRPAKAQTSDSRQDKETRRAPTSGNVVFADFQR